MQEHPQGPAGAIARQHVEIVDVHAAVTVRFADFRRIDVRKPVIGDHLAGGIEDESAERVPLVRVGIDAPILLVEVFVDRRPDVHQRLAVAAQPLVLLAVRNVGARRLDMVGRYQRLLDDVLDVFDPDRLPRVAVRDDLDDLGGEGSGCLESEFAGSRARAADCRLYLSSFEPFAAAVAFGNLAG